MAFQNGYVVPLNPIGATEIAQKLNDGEELSLLDKLGMFQIWSRQWRRHMTNDQNNIVSYVIDRTVSWGKGSFKACTANIIEGTEEYSGVGLPRRSYMRTIKQLENMGVITRKRSRDHVTITLNLNWNPEKAVILPITKRFQSGQKSQTGTSRSATQTLKKCHSGTQSTVVKNTIINNSSFADAQNDCDFPEDLENDFSGEEKELKGDAEILHPGARTAEDFVSGFSAAHDKIVADKRSAAKRSLTKKRPTVTDYEKIWKSAMAETYPTVTISGWGLKDKAAMKTAAKKWFSTGHTFGELIDWSVRHWPALRRKKFGWMDGGAPDAPSLHFFTSDKLRILLANAMMGEDLHQLANAKELDEVERRVLRGQSREEALVDIATGRVVGITRKENAKAVVEAKNENAKARMNNQKAEVARNQALAAAKLGELADRGIKIKTGGSEAKGKPEQKPMVETIPDYDEKRKAAVAARFKKNLVRERNAH